MSNFCAQCGKPLDPDGLPADGCMEFPCPQREAQVVAGQPRQLPANAVRRMATAGIDFAALLATLTVIDTVVWSGAACFLWTGIAPLVAFFIDAVATLMLTGYWLGRDVEGGRYSPGKQIGQFQVVDAETGETATPVQAVTRNAYYALLILAAAIPFVPFGSAGLILAVMGVDALVMYASPDNKRIGDWIAGTRVVSLPPEREL